MILSGCAKQVTSDSVNIPACLYSYLNTKSCPLVLKFQSFISVLKQLSPLGRPRKVLFKQQVTKMFPDATQYLQSLCYGECDQTLIQT